MADPTAIRDIDLTPLPGKTYAAFDREWREEFIYFLMVDRFHDDTDRAPIPQNERLAGFPALDGFYGGTIRGIARNLAYIAGLGCTAIWLSPVFETNAYHGYDTTNYLAIDPRFGTKQDLVELVDAAHGFVRDGQPWPMRVILDVVINHSGDNWSYADGARTYQNDEWFDFGAWRRPDRPVPTELRNEELYHRRGSITDGGRDRYPGNQHGDLYGLKDYANDDDAAGSTLINILIAAHCYWIREADADGFRVDAVKHMGELACARFCSNVREYAYGLGKRGFFLFGEVASPDDEIYDRYIGQNTSRQDGNTTVFFGLNSVLDFRLAQGSGGDNAPLRQVILGQAGPQTLLNRLGAQRDRALNRGEIGRFLVTFVDNHDAFWQPGGRIAAEGDDAQVVGAVGYLLCALGTPCLYYGTEQGFTGRGGDIAMREAMFDRDAPGRNLLNPDCAIYREIAAIAAVVRATPALRFGRMYFRPISGDGQHFGLPFGTAYTLAFARILYGREVLVAYNVSDQPRSDAVVVSAEFHTDGDRLAYRYGGAGDVAVDVAADGTHFVRLPLAPHRFVVLA